MWRALALLCVPALAAAQGSSGTGTGSNTRLDLGGAILANGEEIAYLRSLSLLDTARATSFLVQPFGTSGERALRAAASATDHPWKARFAPAGGVGGAGGPGGAGGAANAGDASVRVGSRWQSPVQFGGLSLQLLRPDAHFIYQSALPTTQPSGVAWAGRGATIALQAGGAAEWKWFRAQLAPVVFQSQNADFDIAPNGRTGALSFGDARFPINIDHPQRFGDAAYGRFDWGDSFVEATAFGLSAGLSNARQHWGPARDYPLVMGTGSGGFAHGYIGTAAPLNVRVGHVQFRLLSGKLEQSEYSFVQSGETARFHTLFLGSFSPAFAPGVEAGAMRLVNGPWPAGGWSLSTALRPFESVINDNVEEINQNADNGFASAFIRIAPPGSGFEVYGEISREDFAGNWRWLAEEPDDLAHYTLGIAQSRRNAAGALTVLRAELTNGEVAHQERGARTLRTPIAPYTHSQTRQGLTNRGQLLGSAATFGGAGGTLTWERYDARGRLRLAGERMTVLDWLPALGPTGGVSHAEVRYGARAELVRFRGDAEWGVTIAPSYTLNRNLEQGRDLFNLTLQLRWRGL